MFPYHHPQLRPQGSPYQQANGQRRHGFLRLPQLRRNQRGIENGVFFADDGVCSATTIFRGKMPCLLLQPIIPLSASISLRRAAIKIGIGRYLYKLPRLWVDYDPQSKQFVKAPQLPAWALSASKQWA